MPVVCDVKVVWVAGMNRTSRREASTGESLWLHNNRFTTFQVPTRYLNTLPRGHVDEFTEFLADFDLLTSVNGKLEVFRSFEDQDNGATQAKSTHLLSRFQRLPIQERRSGGVDGFTVCSGRRKFPSFVCPEILQGRRLVVRLAKTRQE